MKTNMEIKEKFITRIGAGVLGAVSLGFSWVFPYMEGPTNFALKAFGILILFGIFLIYVSIKGKSPIKYFRHS